MDLGRVLLVGAVWDDACNPPAPTKTHTPLVLCYWQLAFRHWGCGFFMQRGP